jgi:magnesium chelatase subunit H
VRKHALATRQKHGCDLETAALRVFSNADGAYGSNVNLLVDNSAGTTRTNSPIPTVAQVLRLRCATARPAQQAELLKSMLADVQLAYQNLDSSRWA